MCNFLSSVSSQQIFEVTDVKALSVSQLLDRLSQPSDRSVLQLLDRLVLPLRVTAQFYLENKGKYILEAEGMPTQKTWSGERGRESVGGQGGHGGADRPFGSAFYVFFPPTPGPALCNLGHPGALLVLPEVCTPVLRPSFVQFPPAFPFLVF